MQSTAAGRKGALDLALVMPVFNEEGCIREVVQAWMDVLSSLSVTFRIIVLDDGSTDGTREALDSLPRRPELVVAHKSNSGHGPTILVGYREAVSLADWVFQCDSDDEINAEHFPELWRARSAFDAVLGQRQGRGQGLARRTTSMLSALTVRSAFGRGIPDPNTPYRLIRAGVLEEIVQRIPPDTFAPNLIVSGALCMGRARILNVPVPCEPRRTGTGSLTSWTLWSSAIRAFLQTVSLRRKLKAWIDVGQFSLRGAQGGGPRRPAS